MYAKFVYSQSLVLFMLPVALSVAEEIDFNQQIRPILSDKCYACHGPDAQQRQAGLRLDTKQGAFEDLGGYAAIVAGKPQESELVSRILEGDADLQMPPPETHKPLSDFEKKLIVEWISQGARWSEHWAYVAPKRSRPRPEAIQGQDGGANNFVDAFILEKLRSLNIQPSAPADPATLLRRLSFDLTGLPPTAEEVRRFEQDPSDLAYTQIVDRLLSSPHFGERIAAYWLDLVRYADTVGYHGDQDVSISPYRDYVISAFNEDLPFDQFTREQLAGDLLPNPTKKQLIASGYNKLGMMSAEGGVQPEEYLVKYAADRVRTTASVWMASTLGCAECHDHKFDPFSTRDFYQFAAYFADIKERGLYSGANQDGNWGPTIQVQDVALEHLLEPLDAELENLDMKLQRESESLTKQQREWEHKLRGQLESWQSVDIEKAVADEGSKLEIQEDGSILAGGKAPNQDVYRIDFQLAEANTFGLRIDALPHTDLPQQGPGRANNGNFVVTEVRLQPQSESSSSGSRIEFTSASATFEQEFDGEGPYTLWSAEAAVDDDKQGSEWGWAILPKVGQPHALVLTVDNPLPAGKYQLQIEQRHSNPRHLLGHFRLSSTSSEVSPFAKELLELSPKMQAALGTEPEERSGEQLRLLRDGFRQVAPELAGIRQEIEKLRQKRDDVIENHTRSTLITVAVEPREIRVLPRGNWMDSSGDVVWPAAPQFLVSRDDPAGPTTIPSTDDPAVNGDLARHINAAETSLKQGNSDEGNSEQGRAGEERADRLDLANWLVSPDNPLTARTMVNRLWKLYFGTGLSKTLDDLGSQGERPSHPRLLDTLAVEFIDSGWDIKHIVRCIVLSNTYRQSSLPRPELESVDPYNRLLARQSRYRLEAELLRDNALAVSGLLVRKIGGRSVKPYQPAGLYQHLNFPTRTYQHDTGANQYRRGLYTHWQRQFLHPAMQTFDAPSREECTAERPRSNTPLAALVLLNDPSYVEAARRLAELALLSAHEDSQSRITWIMERSLGRKASAQEVTVLLELLKEQEEYFTRHPNAAQQLIDVGLSPLLYEADSVHLAAWTSVTRAVLNMHEMVTRN